MKKTEIVYTRMTKPNMEYLKRLKKHAGTSRATCLDEAVSYMRETISETTLIKEIAKRRNKIQKKGRYISELTS